MILEVTNDTGGSRMSNFRAIDRDTGYLLPPSVDKWLPEQHLAWFVVEVVDGLDLSAMSASYRGSGSKSYHPALLLGLLVYGYATGVFSNHKIERDSSVVGVICVAAAVAGSPAET